MSGEGSVRLNGKRILYVTSDWSGLTDVLISPESKPKGMPAFFKPIESMIENGCELEIIVLNSKEIVIDYSKESYFKNAKLTLVGWPNKKSISAVFTLIKIAYQIYSRIRKFKPDFVYAQGPKGALGLLISKLFKVPVGVRVFGIHVYLELFNSKGRLSFILRHPFIYLLFRVKSKFLLATDDGSRADELFAKIGHKKTSLLFWRNGFDELNHDVISANEKDMPSYIFYPSRICEKKQQKKVIELILHLNQIGVQGIRVVLAGHITEEKYYNEVMALAKSVGVDNQIEYSGSLCKEQLNSYMKGALAVLSLQKVSNLGNTLIEALGCGAVVLSFNEEALANFLVDGESALLVNDMKDAAVKLSELSSCPTKWKQISEAGTKALYENFNTWDNRVSHELKVISKCL